MGRAGEFTAVHVRSVRHRASHRIADLSVAFPDNNALRAPRGAELQQV